MNGGIPPLGGAPAGRRWQASHIGEKGVKMRWWMFRDADPLGEAGEVSDGARVLEWAEGRPVVAVSLVVACWMIVVFAIASVYGMLL